MIKRGRPKKKEGETMAVELRLRISEEMNNLLERHCDIYTRQKSAVVRLAIKEFFEKRNSNFKNIGGR